MEKDPKKRYAIPEDWPFQDARDLFLQPDVRSADHEECDFKWEAPDVEGLVKFLVGEKGFSEDRVRSAAQKLQKNVKVAQQARLEGFFKTQPKTEEEKAQKRKRDEEKVAAQKKAKKDQAKQKKEDKSKPHMNA